MVCGVYSEFKEIFDMEYFIDSLKDHVHVVESLPPSLQNIEPFNKTPISWSQVHLLNQTS